jgi:hypothetical protein
MKRDAKAILLNSSSFKYNNVIFTQVVAAQGETHLWNVPVTWHGAPSCYPH